jgi:hypothetical protein
VGRGAELGGVPNVTSISSSLFGSSRGPSSSPLFLPVRGGHGPTAASGMHGELAEINSCRASMTLDSSLRLGEHVVDK